MWQIKNFVRLPQFPIVAVFLIAIVTTALVFWPLINNLSGQTTSEEDGPLIAWLIDHASRSVRGERGLYQAPFFFPLKNTTTYSDPFVTSGIFAAFVQVLVPQITLIEQMNLQLLLGTVAFVLAMYWLLRVFGGDRVTSLLLAVFATFIPLRFVYVVHAHTYLVFGIPLGLAFLYRYFETKRWRFLFGYAVAFLMQAVNAPMTAYFFVTAVVALVSADRIAKGIWRIDRHFFFWTLVVCGIVGVFYLPYLEQALEFQSMRTIRDTAHFSFSLERLAQWDIVIPVLIGFLVYAKFLIKKTFLHIKKNGPAVFGLLLLLVGLLFMLGPVAKIDDQTVKLFGFPIPLPFSIAFFSLPGMSAFRAVTRWSVLASMGLVIFLQFLPKISRQAFLYFQISVFGLAVFSVLQAQQFLPLFSVESDVPQIYQELAEYPESALAILPAYVWSMQPYVSRESVRLLYQPITQKTYYNGVSGFLPPTRAEEIHLLFSSFPSDESIEMLRKNDIELLLVEYDQYQEMFVDGYKLDQFESPNPQSIRVLLESRNDVQLLMECADNNCLYRLL